MTDANGNPISGAKLYIYQAGTLTPVDSYTTSALSVANTNPVVASAAGVFPPVWLQAGDYKFIYTDASDVQLLAPIDNYTVEIEGSQLSYVTSVKTANFTVVAGDRSKMFLVDASGAPGSNVLVTADSDALTSGFPFIVVNTGATGTVTVQGTGGQTVDGVATITLAYQNSAANFVSTGALGWQTIAKSGVNSSITDVLTGTNTSLAVTPESLTGIWKKGASVAGAATITLGNGGLFHITGDSWTCSDIDFAIAVDGRSAKLVIDGTGTTFTNGANLVCPNGQDFKPNAGDVLLVQQDDGDKIILSSLMGGSTEWVKLQEFTMSGADARFNFYQYPEYRDFQVVVSNVALSVTTNIDLRMTISNDDGATFLTGSNYSIKAVTDSAGTATYTAALQSTVAHWSLSNSASSFATPKHEGRAFFYDVQTSKTPGFHSTCFYQVGSANFNLNTTVGVYNVATVIDALKIAPVSGNFTGGKAFLYGRRP
jgi:hypothetical protein